MTRMSFASTQADNLCDQQQSKHPALHSSSNALSARLLRRAHCEFLLSTNQRRRDGLRTLGPKIRKHDLTQLLCPRIMPMSNSHVHVTLPSSPLLRRRETKYFRNTCCYCCSVSEELAEVMLATKPKHFEQQQKWR